MARPPAPADAPPRDGGLYEAQAVRGLFDEMAQTYGPMNYVSSFGFCARWRRACVEAAGVRPGQAAFDLMSGMGECWPDLSRALRGRGRITGVDFSPEMNARAEAQAARLHPLPVTVRQEDVLANGIAEHAADVVVSAFGLKTLSPDQQAVAARELRRVLRPGGRFALVEISLPPGRLLRAPYRWYLRRVIPVLGRLFLGDPDNYRMLGVYTEGWSPAHVERVLREAGLSVENRPLFFGCAALFVGRRPAEG